MLRELKKELQLGALVVLGVGARPVTAGITLMAASLTWGRLAERSRALPPPLSALTPISEDGQPFQVQGEDVIDGEHVLEVTTACGDRAHIRATDPAELGNSTTAGDDTSAGYASTTSSASSDSHDSYAGFWKHGVWQDRERSPLEARAHAGGQGPQRMARKQQRVQAWLRGSWKPAWLEQYIKDKNARQSAQLEGEDTPAVKQEESVSPGDEDRAEEWQQDPVTGWWSQGRPWKPSNLDDWEGVTSWIRAEPAPPAEDAPPGQTEWEGWSQWHDWSTPSSTTMHPSGEAGHGPPWTSTTSSSTSPDSQLRPVSGGERGAW